MDVTDQLMKDISEAFSGPSLFCEIVQNGRILDSQLRLHEAMNHVSSGYWGNGEFLITQRKNGYSVIHAELSYPNL